MLTLLRMPAMVRSNSASSLRSVLLLLGSTLALPGLFAAACVSSSQIIDTSSAASSGGGGAGGEKDDGSICVLHNCKSDSDCGACSEGRKLCNVRDRRCVTCDVATGAGCAEGEFCSDFGSCVIKGLTCDTDVHGIPLVQCASSTDCSACDPAHQVCDESAGKCVACTALNPGNCRFGEQCTAEGICAGACPAACANDDECAACASAEGQAFTCAAKQCVQKTGTDGGTSDDGGTTGGSCHDVCAVGDAMAMTCNACIKAVCTNDDFCCKTEWDSVCVSEVAKYCNQPCTVPPSTCSHNECIVGKKLDPGCSACAGEICANDSFCCDVTWDSTCVGDVLLYCGIKCQ
jgi:hypothetical protein